jgi:hypothetical protein
MNPVLYIFIRVARKCITTFDPTKRIQASLVSLQGKVVYLVSGESRLLFPPRANFKQVRFAPVTAVPPILSSSLRFRDDKTSVVTVPSIKPLQRNLTRNCSSILENLD